MLKEAVRAYGKKLAEEFDHEPTDKELEELLTRAEKEWGLAYLNEAVSVFDQVIEKKFPTEANK